MIGHVEKVAINCNAFQLEVANVAPPFLGVNYEPRKYINFQCIQNKQGVRRCASDNCENRTSLTDLVARLSEIDEH